MLDRFFAVLSITPSFLIHFLPIKCRIKALDMLYMLVRGWSVQSSFWFGQRSGQTSVKLGQPLVKLGQSSPNSGKCIPDLVLRVFGHGGPQSGRKRLGQTWSTLAKTGQTLGNVPQISFRGYLMRLALVGSGRLGLGCLFSRANTRENPGGKNGVMTLGFTIYKPTPTVTFQALIKPSSSLQIP